MYNYYAYVNGIEGARAYPLSPRQTILLMDSDSPVFYWKSSNELGQCTIRSFKFEEFTQGSQNTSQYALKSDLEELQKKMEEFINAKSASDKSTTK